MREKKEGNVVVCGCAGECNQVQCNAVVLVRCRAAVLPC